MLTVQPQGPRATLRGSPASPGAIKWARVRNQLPLTFC